MWRRGIRDAILELGKKDGLQISYGNQASIKASGRLEKATTGGRVRNLQGMRQSARLFS
jgi:hypothetical protein